MVELYAFNSPNNLKVAFMLEECGVSYEVRYVNLMTGSQKQPPFITMNPVGKVPYATFDGLDCGIYGSSAIILHLAAKSGQLLPAKDPERARVLDRFMMVATDLSDAFNRQLVFSHVLPERDEFALKQFQKEIEQFCAIFDGYLRGSEGQWLAGASYSIADVAAAPFFVGPMRNESLLGHFPHVGDWAARVAQRPAIQEGLKRLADAAAAAS